MIDVIIIVILCVLWFFAGLMCYRYKLKNTEHELYCCKVLAQTAIDELRESKEKLTRINDVLLGEQHLEEENTSNGCE